MMFQTNLFCFPMRYSIRFKFSARQMFTFFIHNLSRIYGQCVYVCDVNIRRHTAATCFDIFPISICNLHKICEQIKSEKVTASYFINGNGCCFFFPSIPLFDCIRACSRNCCRCICFDVRCIFEY